MDKKECAALLSMVARFIDTSEPLQAEYFRGYHRGLRLHVLGVSDEKTEEHHTLIESSIGGSGNPYIDSYARGYQDGFEGMTPESISFTSGISSPLPIASNPGIIIRTRRGSRRRG
jgi:hypothetical protein